VAWYPLGRSWHAMHTTRTTTTAHDRSATNSHRQTFRVRAGLALLAAALVSAAACGSDSTTQPDSNPSTTAPTTSTESSSPVAPATAVTTESPSTTTVTADAPTTEVATVSRPTATIDELVGADGERVHVRCVGEGDTTVVLIAGFGGDITGWANVEHAIAARARVCSYDRPGTGTSDPATATATFTTEATDLHDLLRTIGEPGPYVVVGQSFGGAEAVMFAALYGAEVSGLALVDASPTTWPAALCSVPDDGTEAAAIVLGMCAGAFLPTGNSERLDVVAAFTELSSVVSLGSLPMAVITAVDRELPAGLAASEVARLTEAWNQGQQTWASLSTTSHVVTVDHTGHHIEIDQPAVVIDEIIRLLP
jgi:pimeloyl-ACP methyl ester carboxylesterase